VTARKIKTVLILTNSTINLYRFRKELIERLLTDGHSVYLACASDGFEQELKDTGAAYIDTPLNRRGTNLIQEYKLYRQYCRIIREVRPDVILTYTIKPNVYGNLAARRTGTLVVSTITGLGETFMHGGLKGRLIKHLCKWSFKTADCIVFQNTEDEAILRQENIIDKQRILHVPGSGVNLQTHHLLPYPPDATVSFLYVGRIMKAKGVLQLIEATRRLLSEMPNTFTVTLMGFSEGDLQQELEMAENEKIIINAGFQKDIEPFVKTAHCIVLPSYYKEGMNNALLEAAASGRPLIAADISGCREIVDDEYNGFLCKPQDADSLYDCMKRFIELPYKDKVQMGIASRAKAESQFDRNVVIEAMLGAVNHL